LNSFKKPGLRIKAALFYVDIEKIRSSITWRAELDSLIADSFNNNENNPPPSDSQLSIFARLLLYYFRIWSKRPIMALLRTMLWKARGCKVIMAASCPQTFDGFSFLQFIHHSTACGSLKF